MWTIRALRSYYLSGQGSPRQVVQELLAKIAREKDSNAWIHVATHENLAKYLDRLSKMNPQDLPLWGIPFAVKDNIDVEGMPTTAACPDFSYIPREHAPVVERLIEQGAIPLGKTNMDQFATGLVGVRSPYGIVKNPLHPEHITGGSSSGSAAALALGHVAFALGTDTAGSGRVPAAFCGLVGVKPSLGLLSAKGIVPACKSLDCVSIFTHNLDDARLVLDSVHMNPCKEESAPHTLLLPLEKQVQFFGDKSYREPWEAQVRLVQRISDLSIQYVDISPLLETAKLLYQGPWIAERWASLREFVGKNPESCLPLTRSILEQGSRVTGSDVFHGLEALAYFQQQSEQIMKPGCILMLPTAGAIFTQEEVAQEPLLRNQELGTYTNFMNLLRLCGLAIPAGKTMQGLSFGVTLVGRNGSDHALLGMARRLMRETTEIAVLGAHMRGLPLNHELLDCGAEFLREDETSPHYQLFALCTQPAKPGLVRVNATGASIALEVWRIPLEQYGRFVSKIPAPLGIGNIELKDGRSVQGFLCEASATVNATEITLDHGWRNYLKNKAG